MDVLPGFRVKYSKLRKLFLKYDNFLVLSGGLRKGRIGKSRGPIHLNFHRKTSEGFVNCFCFLDDGYSNGNQLADNSNLLTHFLILMEV